MCVPATVGSTTPPPPYPRPPASGTYHLPLTSVLNSNEFDAELLTSRDRRLTAHRHLFTGSPSLPLHPRTFPLALGPDIVVLCAASSAAAANYLGAPVIPVQPADLPEHYLPPPNAMAPSGSAVLHPSSPLTIGFAPTSHDAPPFHSTCATHGGATSETTRLCLCTHTTNPLPPPTAPPLFCVTKHAAPLTLWRSISGTCAAKLRSDCSL